MNQLEYLVITMVQNEYHRQAKHHRLMKLVNGQQPGRAGKIMVWAGRHLIHVGERLQSRATPSTPVVAYSDGFYS